MKRKIITAVVLMVAIMSMLPLVEACDIRESINYASSMSVSGGFPFAAGYYIHNSRNITVNYSFSIEFFKARILRPNEILYSFNDSGAMEPDGYVYSSWDNDLNCTPKFARVHAVLTSEHNMLVYFGYTIFRYIVFVKCEHHDFG